MYVFAVFVYQVSFAGGIILFVFVVVILKVLVVKDNIAMIAEVQLLLSWVSVAKHMGHKYYSIVRKEDFINDCNNLLNNDLNYQSYSLKIESMVKDNQLNNLAVELSLSPNVVLSLITSYYHGACGATCFVPLLYLIGEQDCERYNLSMFELFLSSIYHFSENILGMKQKNSVGKQFLIQYLNFNYGKRIIYDDKFWGLDVRYIDVFSNDYKGSNGSNGRMKKEFGEKSFGIIESLMSSEYYHGMSEKNIGDWAVFCEIIGEPNCLSYCNLVIKYIDKTKKLIKYELDGKTRRAPTLLRLLDCWGITEDEFIARFDLVFKACQLTNAVMPKKTCDTALNKLQKWEQRIQGKDKDKEKEKENNDDGFALKNLQHIQYCVQTIQDHIKHNHQ